MTEKPRDSAPDSDAQDPGEREANEGKDQDEGKDPVDERSKESFPASDPPSY